MDKITPEEFNKINKIIDDFHKSIYDLGDVDYNIKLLKNRIEELSSEKNDILNSINNLKIEEDSVLRSLKSKYPNKNINIQTGVIE